MKANQHEEGRKLNRTAVFPYIHSGQMICGDRLSRAEPGRARREGISLIGSVEVFPNAAAVQEMPSDLHRNRVFAAHLETIGLGGASFLRLRASCWPCRKPHGPYFAGPGKYGPVETAARFFGSAQIDATYPGGRQAQPRMPSGGGRLARAALDNPAWGRTLVPDCLSITEKCQR